MRDGRFLTDQFYFDTGAVMRQMGLMPSLATSQGTLGRGFLWLAVKSMNVLSKAGRASRGRRRAARLKRRRTGLGRRRRRRGGGR